MFSSMTLHDLGFDFKNILWCCARVHFGQITMPTIIDLRIIMNIKLIRFIDIFFMIESTTINVTDSSLYYTRKPTLNILRNVI